MGDGTENQDSGVYFIICGASIFNILGCIFSFSIISLVRKYETEYSSRLVKAIIVASFFISISMLVTPHGYDSDATALPETNQCEWQSFVFVLFSEARWWFTVILFSSECRQVILNSWPTKNFVTHNIVAWGYSTTIAAVGWILTRLPDVGHVYGWQWSGRCGIQTDRDAGAMFLACKLLVNVVLMFWILKYFCLAKITTSRRMQMQSHSPNEGVMGMWMEDNYERLRERGSVYFLIGGFGCLVKGVVMIWELLLLLSSQDVVSVDSGKVSVMLDTFATCIYGFCVFLVLLIGNWGIVKRACRNCCGGEVRNEEDFCFLDPACYAMKDLAEPYGKWEQESHHWHRHQASPRSQQPAEEHSASPTSSPTSKDQKVADPIDPMSPSSTKVSVNPLAEIEVEVEVK